MLYRGSTISVFNDIGICVVAELHCICKVGLYSIDILHFIYFLQDVVPSNHHYKVCEWEQHTHGFIATLRLGISSEEAMLRWKKDLEYKTCVTFRVDQTRSTTGKKVVYKVCVDSIHK